MAEGKDAAVAIGRELKDIERKKAKAVKRGDFNEVSKLCNSAGELLSTNGFFAEAIEWHKEEVKYSEIGNDTLGLAIGHRKIGECLCELSKFEEAIDHQKKHLQLAQSISNCVEEQRALATLGRTYFVMSDSIETELERERCLKDSLDYYLKSFSVSNKLREQVTSKEIHEMRARLCLNIGLVYEWRNQLDQAEKYMEKALISSRENGLKDNMYRCYLSLSGVTAKNKKLQESLRLAKRAQHLAKESKNKSMEADAVFQLGQVFVKLGSFSTAIKLMRQSYKLHPPSLESDKESLFEALRLAIKGERYSQQLNGDVNEEEQLKLVEKLGDLYSEAKSSEKALFYYQKQLDLCKKLNKGSRAISTVYISLAITHAENGDVEKALEFYRKELKLREETGFNNDFKEMSATYSAIAKLLEDSNADKKTVEEAYEKAVEFAEKSEGVHCLLHVYKELSQTLKKFGKLDQHKEVEKKVKYLEMKCEESEESESVKEEEEEEEEEIEDIEEFLQGSESSDDEAKTIHNTRRRRKMANKVNEKGETPLHVVCISGDYSKAKELLEMGASVNSRDFCGWQPLHEACNFGHTEVVKLLLLFGANVNDPGGDHCGNVTPLHDASQNGHFETVKLLISGGANPLIKDVKGRTPLDLVQAAIEADEEELEGSESDYLANRKKVRAYLRKAVHKARPAPQLRNRNVVDQDMDCGEDEHYYGGNLLTTCSKNDDKNMDEYGESVEDSRIDRRRVGRSAKNAANYQMEDDNDTWPTTGFEKTDSRVRSIEDENGCANEGGNAYGASHTDNAVHTNEARHTDEDSTYASMDEDGGHAHSPIMPLESLTANESRLLCPARGSSNRGGSSQGSCLETSVRSGNQLAEQAQLDNEYNPDVASVTPFTSDSEASETELVDGFIVDDIGQSQARKKRRLEGFPRKKTVQQKITIPGQSNSHPKRKVSEKGSKSYVRLSKLKNRIQSRLTSSQTVTSDSQGHKDRRRSHGLSTNPGLQSQRQSNENHRFTVNNGVCESQGAVTDSRSNTQDFDRSVNPTVRQAIDVEWNDMQGVQSPSNLPNRVNIRVRVRIENELLLIPCVDHSERRTIKWLAEQASQRYSSSSGLTPKLSLKTKEGALLSVQDFVSDVLMNNEEVRAQIIGWNTGSICEKYGTECAVLGTDTRADIIHAFALENELQNLDLSDFNLQNSQLKAISRSVTGHSKLSKIDLTGNFIGDDGLECLCGSLKYLPSLVSLNLACTGMTSVGLLHLCKSLSFGTDVRVRTVPGQNLGSPLEELICSYNSFDDSSTVPSSLVSILKNCSRLSKLMLESCFLPMDLFSRQHKFSTALKECRNLIKLSLSGNNFQSSRCILYSIPDPLQDIDLSECLTGDFDMNQNEEFLLTHLQSITMQDLQKLDFINCIIKNDSVLLYLHTLDVSKSNTDREGLGDLLRNIARLKSLKNLNLSCIEAINEPVACNFMQNLVTVSSPLAVLKMASCSVSCLSDVFIECCISCQSLFHLDLSFNGISPNDKQRLDAQWRRQNNTATSSINGSFCIMYTDYDY